MLRRNTASLLAIACLALTTSVHAAELPIAAPAAPALPGLPAGAGAGVTGALGAAAQLPALPAPAAPAVDPAQPASLNAAAEGSRSVAVDTLVDSTVALPGLEGTQPVHASTAVQRKLDVSYRVQANRALTTTTEPAPGAVLAGDSAIDVNVALDGSTSQQLTAAPGNLAVDVRDGALSRSIAVREQSAAGVLPAAGHTLPSAQPQRSLNLTLDTRGNAAGERSVKGQAGEQQQKLERKARPARQLQVQAESLPGSNRVETARQ